ncbi:hypothetical protein CNEO4_110028 [Clostridium neonatale]|uniref:Uncharacterized protein n=1 Tax=Clostridium neonatale TaxID=137838 RepID=A0AA86JZ88_9CLOT|nr:hypothetical protein CNEO_41835 [Clostridium neonatale]CAG9714880.1 hypothetical protein CNEO_2620027 [Clostridium neonatale]CAI3571990.1 hypothetical protein CNEO4_110028 [Clostridium neonatale]CAI3587926.1 hypothetical protein CNEO4_2460004 [Clostridium neonatale]CAI3595977.1 hypothetical protein CNEO4_1660028 [Clostridium neonatale]
MSWYELKERRILGILEEIAKKKDVKNVSCTCLQINYILIA